MDIESKKNLQDFQERLLLLSKSLCIEEKRETVAALEKDMARADFWNNAQHAKSVSQRAESLKKEIEQYENLEKKVRDLEDVLELAASKEDERYAGTLLKECKRETKSLEMQMLFSGEYDDRGAIVTVRSGAGGADAQDWAEMLLRMLLRWCERNNFSAIMMEESRGGEAGIKSATIEVTGQHVYGKLKGESGVHRLVRLSPFNSDNLRQTSFAEIEVMPEVEENGEVELSESDLRIDTYRASGAGGQHVNKTDSAVRVTHTPTGLQAACQSERSQLQNKERAMAILKAKLLQRQHEEREEEKRKLRGEPKKVEWGSQIRSYVLHPYKMVKDHRTNFETAQTEQVLDGDIDGFINAYLQWNAKEA